MARERTGMTPSLLGSALLHGALAAAVLISWPWLGKPVKMDASVPVTIVANAPVSNVRPAVEAPVEAEALTPEPAPEATPEPVAPPEPKPEPAPPPKAQPKPAPPKPAPSKPEPKVEPKLAPKPTAKPAPAKPAPAKPVAKKAPALDLDALAASLKPGKAAGKPKSSARKGPSRAETAVQARPAVGQASALAASALSDLGADLGRRWNANCAVEGGANVDVKIAFRIDRSGRVVRRTDKDGQVAPDFQVSGANLDDDLVKAAAVRAQQAIMRREPFQDLPAELYGQRLIVRFDARSACASG